MLLSFFPIVVIIYLFKYCESVSNTSDVVIQVIRKSKNVTTSSKNVESSDKFQKIYSSNWIAQILDEAQHNFRLTDNTSSQCREDYLTYQAYLKNQTLWAVRMMESTMWPTHGIFVGMVSHLGNFDECLLVAHQHIQGQYCNVFIKWDFTRPKNSSYGNSVVYLPNEDSSVWDTLHMFDRNPIRLTRHRLSWGLCIPSSCTLSDLEISLDNLLQPIFKQNALSFEITNKTSCTRKEPTHFSQGFYIYVFCTLGFIAVTVLSSLYEYYLKKTRGEIYERSTLQKFVHDLSMVNNFKILANMSRADEVSDIHMLKIIYMIAIIFGHRILFLSHFPGISAEMVEMESYPSSFLLANMTVVDVFFFVSGFLLFYNSYKPMKTVGGLVIIIAFIMRWLRMIPILMLVHLFVIHVFPYLGEGPFWNELSQIDVRNCKESFWSNVFFTGNLFGADKQCLYISWYISVDIQLNIIGSLIIYVIAKNRWVGLFLTGLTFIAGAVITFLVVYIKKYNPLPLLYLSFMNEPRNTDEFNYFYTSIYQRIPPYIMGLATGYIILKLQKRNYIFSWPSRIILLTSTLALKLAVVFYGLTFYRLEKEYDAIESALYAALNKALYVVFDCTISIVNLTSSLGLLNKVLAWNALKPIGRLTYCAFLCNTVLQMIHIGNQKAPLQSSSRLNQLWWLMADLGFTYLFAFLLHVFFEAPIYKIGKRVLMVAFGQADRAKEEAMDKAPTLDGPLEELPNKEELPPISESITKKKLACDNLAFEMNISSTTK